MDIALEIKMAYTPDEVAALTGINANTIRGLITLRRIGRGDFPVLFVGPNAKVPRRELIDWLGRQASSGNALELEKIKAQAQTSARAGRPRKVE